MLFNHVIDALSPLFLYTAKMDAVHLRMERFEQAASFVETWLPVY